MSDKQNCWEFKNCGREAGGAKVADLGVCPAATIDIVHGTNSGTNAGRACWAVAGTLCGGEMQGTYAAKFRNCISCEFFKLVNKEEGSDYIATEKILISLGAMD